VVPITIGFRKITYNFGINEEFKTVLVFIFERTKQDVLTHIFTHKWKLFVNNQNNKTSIRDTSHAFRSI